MSELQELRTKLAALEAERDKTLARLWELLAPTDEENQMVTDSLLDQAQDCPEVVTEDLGYRVLELENMREMEEGVRAEDEPDVPKN